VVPACSGPLLSIEWPFARRRCWFAGSVCRQLQAGDLDSDGSEDTAQHQGRIAGGDVVDVAEVRWHMKLVVAIFGSLLLLAIAAFCAFGFLATFEPTDNALVFRVGYTVIGLGCVVGVGFLIVKAVRKESE